MPNSSETSRTSLGRLQVSLPFACTLNRTLSCHDLVSISALVLNWALGKWRGPVFAKKWSKLFLFLSGRLVLLAVVASGMNYANNLEMNVFGWGGET